MRMLLLVTLFSPVCLFSEEGAPTGEECKATDPLKWCTLRVNDAAAGLEHMRTCADIALVDAVDQTVSGYNVGVPLRKAIWRGFEDHVCAVRESIIVVEGEEYSRAPRAIDEGATGNRKAWLEA